MKKSRLLMIIMSVMMVGAMAFAFAGCGGDEESQATDETAEAVATEEEPAVEGDNSLLEDPEYDIYKVLVNAGLEDVLDASGVEYDINQFSNITTEIAIKTSDDEYDGVVGSIMAYKPDDTEYKDLPDYKVIGEQDGVVYVLMLPTDVRYNAENPQQSSDYEKLTEALKTFEIK